MKLVNQIGNAYSLSGDNEKAADIFYRLLQYIRRHLPETVTSNRMLPLVLYNLARSLDLSQKYEEGAKVARCGKEACIKIWTLSGASLVFWKSKLNATSFLGKKGGECRTIS